MIAPMYASLWCSLPPLRPYLVSGDGLMWLLSSPAHGRASTQNGGHCDALLRASCTCGTARCLRVSQSVLCAKSLLSWESTHVLV